MGGELPGRARTTHLSNIRDGIELDEEEDQIVATRGI